VRKLNYGYFNNDRAEWADAILVDKQLLDKELADWDDTVGDNIE